MSHFNFKLVDIFAALILFAVFLFIEIGFFYVDPYVLGTQSSGFLIKSFLWFIRIVIFLAAIGCFLLYLNLRSGKIKPSLFCFQL